MKKSLLKKTIILNTTFLTYLLIFLSFFSLNSVTAAKSKVFFDDDFENGISKWQSVTGLWHLTTNSSHSLTHSMWFGNESTGNYDQGYVTGSLISIPFDLSRAINASLEFYHWKEVEELGFYDMSSVVISNDSINWNQIYWNNTNVLPWERLSFDISAYCGNSSVQIRFYFDSIDDEENNYRGWFIDDVFIQGVVKSKLSEIPGYPIIGIILTIALISLVVIKMSKKNLNI
ncbi:MAG: hypothetical protein ACFE9T_07635 [Promethearchaeota archaeon]